MWGNTWGYRTSPPNRHNNQSAWYRMPSHYFPKRSSRTCGRLDKLEPALRHRRLRGPANSSAMCLSPDLILSPSGAWFATTRNLPEGNVVLYERLEESGSLGQHTTLTKASIADLGHEVVEIVKALLY